MKKFLAIILCLAMMVSVVAVSTFATEEPEYDVLPVIDGEVEEGEYTNVKVYDEHTRFSANCWGQGQVVTEYVAHDADYVYFALTYNVDLKNCAIRMNGRANVKTDIAASEYIYEFQFEFGADMDTADLNCAGGNFQDVEGFDAEAGEIYGKASKIFEGDEVVATHFEIKILKEAMKRVFEVNSIDYFGYYAQAKTVVPFTSHTNAVSTSDIVNGAKFTSLNGNDAHGNWTGGSGEIVSTYGLDGTYYLAKYRFMNFVVFGEEPAEHNVYCPAGDNCACTNHGKRAEVMDLTDTVNLGTLKSNYVTKMLVAAPPATTTEASTTEPTTAEPTTAEPTTAEPTTAEPTTAEPTTADPTTADPTTAEPTTAEPTTAEATTAEATTKAATTAATTAAEEKGCGKSIALSALAIVPVLGLGVAVVSKKKED